MKRKTVARRVIHCVTAAGMISAAGTVELFQAPKPETHTRWISPENPTGAKGAGGKANKGAKGAAFIVVAPGETAVLADIRGAGIIRRMWLSGTPPRTEEQRRLLRLQMFWDGAKKPAVDCPIGDFFGVGLGLAVPFENALFSNPEGRSFNFTIPMPYRKGAKMLLVNEAKSYALVWYDINYTEQKVDADAMYFHAAWRRELKPEAGSDFEIMPRVTGKGRYLGMNIGVVGGDPAYRGTWFGEGEVKIYLDGDKDWPTLVGTGTEDYIGSGWGQGVYHGRYAGSLVSDEKNDVYAFYRYHLDDPVYFHKDCRVTIQQIGNSSTARVRDMISKGLDTKPLWVLDTHGEDVLNITKQAPAIHLLLEATNLPPFNDPKHPQGSTHYWRQDDVSATVYFYLDKPENNLPPLASGEIRMQNMRERVWNRK
jgi:hypothetical protein